MTIKFISNKGESLQSILDEWVGDDRLTKNVMDDFFKGNKEDLNLNANGLDSLSKKIFDFDIIHKITSLNLIKNNFISIPLEITSLQSLKKLYLSANKITYLPPEIGKLQKLTHLYLAYNKLEKLPPEIGNLLFLQDLNLSDNLLSEIPKEVGDLQFLETLNLDNNPLDGKKVEISRIINKLSYLTLHPIDKIFINKEQKPIYKGFIYHILDSTGKQRGHLAGSIHIAVNPEYELHQSMKDAFEKAATVIVELNLLDLPDMRDSILKGHLYEATECKILRMAKRDKKKIDQLETFAFQEELLEKEILSSENKKDFMNIVIRSLALRGKEIQTLDLSEADLTDVFSARAHLKKVLEGYKAGEKSILKPFLITDKEASLQKNIFWDRNIEMANKIDAFLQKQDSLFILIGTGHLWGTKEEGKKGVVALLRDKGWNVEKIKMQ
ncbi:TraB/GumN family protein [Candidatus Rhabdochlamydia sp. T3358]|uniref:TraB/GumN family protein n=1 Tax=Candidatus Rhabdochlamydia sp. T3358 TaxID=2099795 RepID=UPI0010B67541|nr:TraB/GumN family protein [Candidatus Rhabdochlamydia sp. T3358]VHO02623.1 Leucine Rich repeats (2 copies) [Candidatus Rhabdochlamydia sp. T3358]